MRRTSRCLPRGEPTDLLRACLLLNGGFYFDLSAFELLTDQVILPLLEKYKAALVSEAAVVTFLIDVDIWLFNFFIGYQICLQHQKKVEKICRTKLF